MKKSFFSLSLALNLILLVFLVGVFLHPWMRNAVVGGLKYSYTHDTGKLVPMHADPSYYDEIVAVDSADDKIVTTAWRVLLVYPNRRNLDIGSGLRIDFHSNDLLSEVLPRFNTVFLRESNPKKSVNPDFFNKFSLVAHKDAYPSKSCILYLNDTLAPEYDDPSCIKVPIYINYWLNPQRQQDLYISFDNFSGTTAQVNRF